MCQPPAKDFVVFIPVISCIRILNKFKIGLIFNYPGTCDGNPAAMLNIPVIIDLHREVITRQRNKSRIFLHAGNCQE